MKNLLLIITATIALTSCTQTISLEEALRKTAKRPSQIHASEIAGTWKGQTALSMHLQERIELTLKANGTWSTKTVDQHGKVLNLLGCNASGTFYTTVEKTPYEHYDHTLYLDWQSPYGLRTSAYQLYFLVKPDPDYGDHSQYSATKETEMCFTIRPIRTFLFEAKLRFVNGNTPKLKLNKRDYSSPTLSVEVDEGLEEDGDMTDLYSAEKETALSIADAKAEEYIFLNKNKAKDGVSVTESGLQYSVITEGNGPKPLKEDKVKVHYTGKLTDGTIFDSSVERGEPAVFAANQVIPGWTEALPMMPVGSKWELVIPSNLGYGPRAQGPIPANATLVFEVELLEIVQ